MRSKIITLCGSMRFLDQLHQLAEQLSLREDCVVLTPIPHVLEAPLTPQQQARLAAQHRARIDLSDAIYVVDPGGYIGSAVASEIAYALEKGKEIFYLEPPKTP